MTWRIMTSACSSRRRARARRGRHAPSLPATPQQHWCWSTVKRWPTNGGPAWPSTSGSPRTVRGRPVADAGTVDVAMLQTLTHRPDQPRSGRPPQIDEIDVVVATLAEDGRPPARLGVTHWSARLLAAGLGISFATVARIWRKWKRLARNPRISLHFTPTSG